MKKALRTLVRQAQKGMQRTSKGGKLVLKVLRPGAKKVQQGIGSVVHAAGHGGTWDNLVQSVEQQGGSLKAAAGKLFSRKRRKVG